MIRLVFAAIALLATACQSHSGAEASSATTGGFRIKTVNDQEAVREIRDWVAHSMEMGNPPHSVEIVDKRILAWPGDPLPQEFYLLKVLYEDDLKSETGIGVVGSLTYTYWGERYLRLSAEELYGIHCYRELSLKHLIREFEDPHSDASAFLANWEGPGLEKLRCRLVSIPNEDLGFGGKCFSVAQAWSKGEQGYAVADGNRSRWYQRSELPKGIAYDTVLRLHAGRRILGVGDQVKRLPLCPQSNLEVAPHEIVSRFGLLEAKARALALERGKGSPMLLDPVRVQVIQGLVGYAKALTTLGRGEDFDSSLSFLKHFLGKDTYELGKAAFICNRFPAAKGILEVIFQGPRKAWDDSGAMLAQIYIAEGRPEVAKELLLECMREVLSQSKNSAGKQKDFFESAYETHWRTFVRSFPEMGVSHLRTQSLPEPEYPEE